MKTYKVLRDLPGIKAGEERIVDETKPNGTTMSLTFDISQWHEWFEEVIEKENKPIIPKSIEQIIEEYKKETYGYDMEYPMEDFLRSSLASFLVYAVEEVLPKVNFVGTNLSVYIKEIEEYRLALLALAESINKTDV